MAEQFQPGDTVRLKSGGPLMTVEKIWSKEKGTVRVTWFKDDEPCSAVYHAVALRKASGGDDIEI